MKFSYASGLILSFASNCTPIEKDYILHNFSEKIREPVYHNEDFAEEWLREYICSRLENLEHTTYSDIEIDHNTLLGLRKEELFFIYKALDSLKSTEFRKELGNLMEADFNDYFREHGGLIEIVNGKLELIPVTSSLPASLENNTYYHPPEEIKYIPHLGEYHFHAAYEDNSCCAGPSFWNTGPRGAGYFYGDVGYAVYKSQNRTFHGLVITKLEGKFNVDYFGCYRFNGEKKVNILDLGDYDY